MPPAMLCRRCAKTDDRSRSYAMARPGSRSREFHAMCGRNVHQPRSAFVRLITQRCSSADISHEPEATSEQSLVRRARGSALATIRHAHSPCASNKQRAGWPSSRSPHNAPGVRRPSECWSSGRPPGAQRVSAARRIRQRAELHEESNRVQTSLFHPEGVGEDGKRRGQTSKSRSCDHP